MVEKSSGHKVIELHTDNGGEYTSTEFQSYLLKEGIRHQLTVSRMPEQNGVVKQLNRTLIELDLCSVDLIYLRNFGLKLYQLVCI